MTKTYYQFLEKKNKIQDTERTSKKNILFIMEELIDITFSLLEKKDIDFIDYNVDLKSEDFKTLIEINPKFTFSSFLLWKKEKMKLLSIKDSILDMTNIKSICYSPTSDSFMLFITDKKIADFLYLEFQTIMQDITTDIFDNIFFDTKILMQEVDNNNFLLEICYNDILTIKKNEILNLTKIICIK